MPRLARFVKPAVRRAGSPAVVRADQLLARRLEETAARLEAHTVNPAREQDRIAAEGLRGVITEVRANSTFIADAVAAGRTVTIHPAPAAAATTWTGLVVERHAHLVDGRRVTVDRISRR